MTNPSRVPAAPERWTILEMIRWSTGYLQAKGVEGGRLDAEHMLAEALGLGRLELYLQFERPLTPEERERFKPLLLRRAAREPLQYILGHTQFRELEVKTDRRGLIPRPETEVLVQEVLDWSEGREGLRALDLGTGTGVIALSLRKEGPFETVVATDVATNALGLAAENAAANGIDGVEFREGDLFGALEPEWAGGFDVLVSNPPYVEAEAREQLQPEVKDWEPEGALFAGPGGFEVIDRLVEGAGAWLRPGGLIALEVGSEQTEAVRDRMGSVGHFENIRIRRDLAGRPRIVKAERA